MNERLLMFLIPVLLLAVFTTCMMLYKYNTPGSDQLKAKDSPKAFSFETVQDSCICNNGSISGSQKFDNSFPVLGGVDMVQFFTAFRLPDGSYNDSEVGQQGSNLYSSVYNNYTYYFLSEENKRFFIKKQSDYIPQWGGFDAWSVASYECPSTPWSPFCLESESSWQHWGVQNEKIYFFQNSVTRTAFLHNLEDNIMVGDAKWDAMHSKSGSAIMSTTRHEGVIAMPQKMF